MHEIKVGEVASKLLLDRDGVIADVHRAYEAQLKVLTEVTNYGTNLIPRSFTSSDKSLKAVIVIGTLLRQVVAMLDAIEVLTRNGAVYAAGLQARTLFEASAYLEWILKQDSETRAYYYHVHNLRRDRRWALRMHSGTAEANAIPAAMRDLSTLKDPNTQQQSKRTVDRVNTILAQPEFVNINQAFDDCAVDAAKFDRPWHYPLGKRTVAALISDLGRAEEYTVFYSTFSEATHSSHVGKHVSFGDATVTFKTIRELSGFAVLFQFSISNAIRCYLAILREYRPGELTGGVFSRKYIDRWQTAFMNVPKIEYREKKKGPAGEQ